MRDVTGATPALLDVVPEAARRRLMAEGRRRRFGRGEVVFHEGDPGDSLHVVLKGHVAIKVTTLLGDVATLTILGPDASFGEGALLGGGVRTASAVAVESAETLQVGAALFEELRREEPGVERLLTAVLADQVRRLSTHLAEALFAPADQRVLRRLLHVGELYATAADPKPEIPLTQDDLAQLAGTTRPTANRVLKAAEADGLVALSRGKVRLVDLDALRRRAR